MGCHGKANSWQEGYCVKRRHGSRFSRSDPVLEYDYSPLLLLGNTVLKGDAMFCTLVKLRRKNKALKYQKPRTKRRFCNFRVVVGTAYPHYLYGLISVVSRRQLLFRSDRHYSTLLAKIS